MTVSKLQIELWQNIVYHSCYYTLNQVDHAKKMIKLYGEKKCQLLVK
jgi:hypothetical protein